MSEERLRQIEQLYHAALEHQPQQRAAFLAEACLGDEDLRREVESFLSYQEVAESFIETPAPKLAATELAKHNQVLEKQPTKPRMMQAFGSYQILALLGRGGMGEVYLAEDVRLGRKVAIKLLPAEFTADAERVRRFEREARAASSLNHPNIVTIYEIGEAVAGRYIAMELIEGQTLRALTRQQLSLDALPKLVGQIAEALSVAHTAGIIHRDIKPENIMVRTDGYVKVLDFGLARLVPTDVALSECETTVSTSPGIILGTASYMSPEQACGETMTSATDVFSLGIVFYEIATGQHPFQASSLRGMLETIISHQPPAPSHLNPEIPTALDSLILHMLEKDARLRPTATEVDAALGEMFGKRTTLASEPMISSLITSHTVGREKERAELQKCFESTAAGRGLLLCVSGEPGMGKTTLVEGFLNELATGTQPCHIARGRCSERLAGSEAYLPWLEALDSLIHDAGGESAARASQMTKQGGNEPMESPDSHFIYYHKSDKPDTKYGMGSIWRMPVEGGREERIFDGVVNGFWAIGERGIYFINRKVQPRTIELYSFATGRVRKIAAVEKELRWGAPGFAVSSDGKWILYTQMDQSGSDIMVADNFH